MANLTDKVTMLDILNQLTTVSTKVDTLIPKRMIANVTKHGDVVETDGILSNFSSTNFASIPVPDVGTINSYELVVKITTGNSVSDNQVPVGYLQNSHRCPWIYAPSKNQNGKIRFHFPLLGGQSSEYVDSKFVVQANTTYWLKATNEGTVNTAYYSLDGENYTRIGSPEISYNRGAGWSEPMTLGNLNNSTPFLGTIDLNECYIKLNNELWWSGMIEAES